jgi:hypothetical protein
MSDEAQTDRRRDDRPSIGIDHPTVVPDGGTRARDMADPRPDGMKRRMAEHFEAFEHEYREDDDTDATVVYEDDQVVVVADFSGHELNEWSDDFGVDRDALSEFFHVQARKITDYDWGYADPVLFDKFEEGGA